MTSINYNEVLAIRPEYIKDKGDCTEIIFESGETYTAEKNINSVKSNMAHYYCADLKATRKIYGEMLPIKNHIPILLSDKHILVAYKARKPYNKRDGAYGYISLDHFSHVDAGETNYIVLTNGIRLELHQKPDSFEKRVILAKMLIDKRR